MSDIASLALSAEDRGALFRHPQGECSTGPRAVMLSEPLRCTHEPGLPRLSATDCHSRVAVQLQHGCRGTSSRDSGALPEAERIDCKSPSPFPLSMLMGWQLLSRSHCARWHRQLNSSRPNAGRGCRRQARRTSGHGGGRSRGRRSEIEDRLSAVSGRQRFRKGHCAC